MNHAMLRSLHDPVCSIPLLPRLPLFLWLSAPRGRLCEHDTHHVPQGAVLSFSAKFRVTHHQNQTKNISKQKVKPRGDDAQHRSRGFTRKSRCALSPCWWRPCRARVWACRWASRLRMTPRRELERASTPAHRGWPICDRDAVHCGRRGHARLTPGRCCGHRAEHGAPARYSASAAGPGACCFL